MKTSLGNTVEIIHYLKKIVGKFMKDEGIYTFAKPTLAIILSEQQISVSEVWSDVLDLSLLGPKVFFIQNEQDVPVYVGFYVRPSPNSIIEAPIREDILVDSGEIKIALLRDRFPACRLKFYAKSSPSEGYVNCVLASWSM